MMHVLSYLNANYNVLYIISGGWAHNGGSNEKISRLAIARHDLPPCHRTLIFTLIPSTNKARCTETLLTETHAPLGLGPIRV